MGPTRSTIALVCRLEESSTSLDFTISWPYLVLSSTTSYQHVNRYIQKSGGVLEYNSSYTEDDLGQTCEINSTVVIELVPYFCSILTLSLVDKAFTDSKESYITVKSHKAGLRTGKLDHYLKVPRSRFDT